MMEKVPDIEVQSSPEWWREYIVPREGESAEGYVNRAFQNVADHLMFKRFKNSLIESSEAGNETDTEEEGAKEIYEILEPLIAAQIEKIIDNPRSQMSKKHLTEEFLNFERHDLIEVVNGNLEAETKADYFSASRNNRDLFKVESRGASIYQIFGIPAHWIKKRDSLLAGPLERLLDERINGKIIYLLGGGDSGQDFLQSEKFHPQQVINIDPYHQSDTVAKNNRKLYRSLSVGAQEINLTQMLEEESIPKADEIWATYSVPCYLETAGEIKQLFENIDKVLNVGGVARIYPLRLINFKTESPQAFKGESVELRKKAWDDSILELLRSGRYNFELVNNAMRLEKLSD